MNAAKKFFDIVSGSEFVAFLGYGNELEAFAKNRFSAFESGRFSGIVNTVLWFWFSRGALLFFRGFKLVLPGWYTTR